MKRKKFLKMGALTLITLPGLDLFASVYSAEYEITLRIHHFFDIISAFARGGEVPADMVYKHSNHLVARQIRDNTLLKMKLIVGVDAVCEGCIYNINNKCNDMSTSRSEFNTKDSYNYYLDKRIMKICKVNAGQIMTPKEICLISDKYINSMEYIYEIDGAVKTAKRKKNFIQGLKYYADKNQLQLDFLDKV